MLRSLFVIWIFALHAVAQAGQTLVIGDSHTCGTFGQSLMKRLAKDGSTVDVYCTVSSSAVHWVQGTNPSGQKCQMYSNLQTKPSPCNGSGVTPRLEDLLKRKAYDRVVVALGTNSLSTNRADTNHAKLAQLAARSSRGGCDWIGPPNIDPARAKGFDPRALSTMQGNLGGFYSSLQSQVGQDCRVKDSRPLTGRGQGGGTAEDGVHRFSQKAGESWAAVIDGQSQAQANPGKPAPPAQAGIGNR